MENYPKIAQKLVDEMTKAAALSPEKTVSFQGAPGANSHLAAINYFPDGLPLPCFSFEDAIDAVKDGIADHAIIPIENSLHGRVADIHFLLPESGLSIVGEYFMPIQHCLMAKSAALSINAAISHPQALGQCRLYLRRKNIKPISYADTAAAAALVADMDMADNQNGQNGQNGQNSAAIAPSLAAKLYGLSIIEQGIEDADHNMTRFVVLAREAAKYNQNNAQQHVMTTFIFEVKNIPAALYKAMGGFATNGVNMTKLESYQLGGSFSATEFYADIVGAPGDEAVDRALAELAFHCKKLRILGTYPMARKRG
ncbi:prephenate dehydratase [Sphingorhabdus lutea]|uniref:prephenate dehydratase n=1 Tax=Sphingorhabdus lutea TaxID=1913578 RepID=A0A1L3JDQ9_9SPHN|nr:prephenate dehydratase [Sphingorhabdus lutea]APG63287.1 prephenate dehydratase [Sphingorhabdus lutea]